VLTMVTDYKYKVITIVHIILRYRYNKQYIL